MTHEERMLVVLEKQITELTANGDSAAAGYVMAAHNELIRRLEEIEFTEDLIDDDEDFWN